MVRLRKAWKRAGPLGKPGKQFLQFLQRRHVPEFRNNLLGNQNLDFKNFVLAQQFQLHLVLGIQAQNPGLELKAVSEFASVELEQDVPFGQARLCRWRSGQHPFNLDRSPLIQSVLLCCALIHLARHDPQCSCWQQAADWRIKRSPESNGKERGIAFICSRSSMASCSNGEDLPVEDSFEHPAGSQEDDEAGGGCDGHSFIEEGVAP
jgi:hypothetical protein